MLNSAGLGINLNRNFLEIKSNIKHVASEIRRIIRDKLAGHLVGLMLDIASKNNRSVIGIGVQYRHEGATQIHSLGIIALNELHTADYITRMVKDCLRVFEVPITNVVAITTDNASAMLAMIRQFDENVIASSDLVYNDEYIDAIDVAMPVFEKDSPLTESDLQSVMQAVADIDALNNVLDDDNQRYEDLFEKIIGETSRNTTIVSTIRCGAHSIQLIVRNGIKNSSFNSLLLVCKYVSKKLRTEKFKYSARDAHIDYAIPHMSNETRWDSDYMMVCICYPK